MRVLVIAAVLTALAAGTVAAHDDGRYAQSPLKQWFDGLRSGRGPCCSDADGVALADDDWRSGPHGYQVRIAGGWYDVPADAVLPGPNLAGRTMVWSYQVSGFPVIRCFLPGTMV